MQAGSTLCATTSTLLLVDGGCWLLMGGYLEELRHLER